MGQRCRDLALYRNRMLADLSMKFFAERDDVIGALL